MINRLVATTLPLLPKRFVWLFSRSYIAGERVDDTHFLEDLEFMFQNGV